MKLKHSSDSFCVEQIKIVFIEYQSKVFGRNCFQEFVFSEPSFSFWNHCEMASLNIQSSIMGSISLYPILKSSCGIVSNNLKTTVSNLKSMIVILKIFFLFVFLLFSVFNVYSDSSRIRFYFYMVSVTRELTSCVLHAELNTF